MPELATHAEEWNRTHSEDHATFRTVRDLRAIGDRLGTEYLEVLVEQITVPAQAEEANA